MKRADIQKILDSDPRTPFAVRVPRFWHGRKVGIDIVKAVIEGFNGKGRVVLEAHPTAAHPHTDVGLPYVLAPWDEWKLNQDWDLALQMDRRRDEQLRYERKCAERTAAIEALLPAFEGIMVPADSLSSSAYDRPDENLADALRATFADARASGANFGWEVFAALAEHIMEIKQRGLDLETRLLEIEQGWGGEATDTGVPAITPLVPRTPLSEIERRLAKLEAARSALPSDALDLCPRCGPGAEGVCSDPECPS